MVLIGELGVKNEVKRTRTDRFFVGFPVETDNGTLRPYGGARRPSRMCVE
jgi:hypothetical protein